MKSIHWLTYDYIENVNAYAVFLMFVGILGMISFGLSFAICYLKGKGYDP